MPIETSKRGKFLRLARLRRIKRESVTHLVVSRLCKFLPSEPVTATTTVVNVSARHISSADASLGNASFFIILHITLCKGEALRAFGPPNFGVNENMSAFNKSQSSLAIVFDGNLGPTRSTPHLAVAFYLYGEYG